MRGFRTGGGRPVHCRTPQRNRPRFQQRPDGDHRIRGSAPHASRGGAEASGLHRTTRAGGAGQGI